MAASLPTGLWKSDLAHSFIWISVPHRGLTRIRGRFREFTATYTVDDVGQWVGWTVDVKAASIDTNDLDRDNLIRSMDYFDIVSHPTHRFVSTSIEPGDDHSYDVLGNLTMNGLTHQIRFNAQAFGAKLVRDHQRAGFLSATSISRAAFGLAPPDSDTAALDDGDLVDVGIEVEAVLIQT